MSAEDPFYVVKEEVSHSVSVVQALFQRWKELLEDSTTVGNQEYEWTTSELNSGLRSIEWDLEDLDKVIRVIEGSGGRWKLEDAEVNARKQFIEETRQTIQGIKAHIDSPATTARVEKEQRDALFMKDKEKSLFGNRGRYAKLDDAIARDNELFIRDEEHKQQLIVRKQDDDLDELAEHAEKIGQIGLTINEELTDQNKMLEEFDEEVDHADGRMKQAMKQVKHVLTSSKDRGQICTIIILFVILIVLLFLVIYS